MAGNLSETQINKAVGWAYLRNNKKVVAPQSSNIVGWGFHPNKENAVALKKSGGCESFTDKNTAITPLTTASYEAETLVLSGFQGGGGATRKTRATSAFQAHEVCSYIWETAKGGRSPLLYIRILVNACMSSRSGLRARQTKNHRLAGSQTKIRHKLKSLCEII